MRQRSVPRTVVSGSSCSPTGPELWPTPTVTGNYNRKGASKESGDGLATMAARGWWPTPMASDAKAGSLAGSLRRSPQLRDLWATPKATDAEQPGRTLGKLDARQPLTVQVGGGRLNPTWVEWLMGLPLGWTHVDDEPASAALGMAPSSSKSRSRS